MLKKLILAGVFSCGFCTASFAEPVDSRISLENVRASSASESAYIIGDLTNSSGKEFSTVCVSYKLYDDNNTMVGNAQDCAQNLGAGEKWHFKALSPEKFRKFEYGSAVILEK